MTGHLGGCLSGQPPYDTVGYALTEWGSEGSTGQDATNFLTAVWNDPVFQGLTSLRAAYWYCDYCRDAEAKGIFKNTQQPPPDCALTSMASPGSVDCVNEAAVCGETFASL